MRVLLTDGNERATLAAARSLISAGHDIHVCAARAGSLAGVSRGVREAILFTDAMTDASGYARALGRAALDTGADLVIPMSDQAVVAMLEFGDPLPSGCVLAAPSQEAYALAANKADLLGRAVDVGFHAPPHLIVQRFDSQPDDDTLSAFVPGYVKPHRSVIPCGRGLRKMAVHPVAGVPECRAALRRIPSEGFPVIVQRTVVGPGVGLFAFRWDGALRAIFAHRRVREIPLSGGVSVCRESADADDEVSALADRLLGALHWQGVAMIECKRDGETGRLSIMEINPRFWGSLQLAIDAGVDFPRILVDAYGGTFPPTPPHYAVGVRSRWEWGEVDHVYLRVKDARAHGAVGFVAGLRAARALLRWGRRDRFEIFRWSDPRPFLADTRDRITAAFRKVVGRIPRPRA